MPLLASIPPLSCARTSGAWCRHCASPTSPGEGGSGNHPARITSRGAPPVNVISRQPNHRERVVADQFDVIIIGTGAGGGTLAHTIAPSGKRVLVLERGNFLTRELENWDPGEVFVDGRYISADTWYDAEGKPFQPQVHYFVGGATKLYGAGLYRGRPAHFLVLWAADA